MLINITCLQQIVKLSEGTGEKSPPHIISKHLQIDVQNEHYKAGQYSNSEMCSADVAPMVNKTRPVLSVSKNYFALIQDNALAWSPLTIKNSLHFWQM